MTSAACPQCTLANSYVEGGQYVCADGGFEWPRAAATEPGGDAVVVRDSNGNVLADRDTVVVIKDLR